MAEDGERIVLERRGKSVVALVSMQDLALLEELENQADIRAAKKRSRKKGRFRLPRSKSAWG